MTTADESNVVLNDDEITILIMETRQGSADAGERLFLRLTSQTQAVCQATLKGHHASEIDDVNQTAWMRILEKLRKLAKAPDGPKFRGLIIQIATQASLDYLQESRRPDRTEIYFSQESWISGTCCKETSPEVHALADEIDETLKAILSEAEHRLWTRKVIGEESFAAIFEDTALMRKLAVGTEATLRNRLNKISRQVTMRFTQKGIRPRVAA